VADVWTDDDVINILEGLSDCFGIKTSCMLSILCDFDTSINELKVCVEWCSL
jgi:hypothetical protein